MRPARPSGMALLTWPLLALGLCICLHASSAQDLEVGTFPFSDIDIHYQMYDSGDPTDPVALFLHGKAFTSDVWVPNTLALAFKEGYKAIAIDLPAFGKTRHLPYVDNNMRAEVIKATLQFATQGHNLTSVLVTPSMSGRWAIPFLDRYGQMLSGWVAIAPVGVKSWTGPWEFTHKQVRLLAMYGERDPMKAEGEYLTKLFLKTTLEIIPEAGHACYVDKPEPFLAALSRFLKDVDPHHRVSDVHKGQSDEM